MSEKITRQEEKTTVSKNRIVRCSMRMALLIQIQRKRRKWIKYEREHSMELWHTDWAKLDKRFIAYLDDASRFVVGYGLLDGPTSENALKVLDDAVLIYGKPDSMLTDRRIPLLRQCHCKGKGPYYL